MASYQYCTPEWLAETEKNHQTDPSIKEKLKKLTGKFCYRVKAEPAWGIEKDIIFGTFYKQGELEKISFFSENDAIRESDYLMAATPQVWKTIIRKEKKFVTEFMLKNIELESGSKVGVFMIAPLANFIVDAMTQEGLQFQDEMTEEELSNYRSYMKEFREKLGV